MNLELLTLLKIPDLFFCKNKNNLACEVAKKRSLFGKQKTEGDL